MNKLCDEPHKNHVDVCSNTEHNTKVALFLYQYDYRAYVNVDNAHPIRAALREYLNFNLYQFLI